MRDQAPDDGTPLLLWGLLASLTALLLGFSQTFAFFGDEGFHLLVARLVIAGKRVYLDFFYSHVRRNAYLSAAWQQVLGHLEERACLVRALDSASAVLVTWYVVSRARGSRWQLATATTAALLMGLNILVIWYGTIGHTYGPSLFLSVATFLLVIASVDRVSGPQPFLAGLWAGTASASLLLTAPVAPIPLLWSLRHPGSEERPKKGACFLAGTGRPLLPLLWPMAHGPRQVVFDVVGSGRAEISLEERGLSYRAITARQLVPHRAAHRYAQTAGAFREPYTT